MAKGISISNSGLDTDELVKASMQGYQMNYDKAYKKKVYKEWQKEAYNDTYTAVKKYRDNLFNDYIGNSSGLTSKKVSSSNEGIVTATSNSDGINTTHDVVVKQLAQNASLSTMNGQKASVPDPSGTGTSNRLADIAGIDLSTVAAGDMDNVALSFEVADGDSVVTLSYTYRQLQEANNGDGKNLNDIAYDIRRLGLNLTANYDSTNDVFSISNTLTGEKNRIQITTAAGSASETFLNNLNLGQYDSATGATTSVSATDLGSTNIKGKDAVMSLDGRDYTSEKNQITVAGITYTLKGVSPDDPAHPGTKTPAKLSVDTDVDALIDNVQKFLDSYNEILGKLNVLISEEKFSGYDPLTEDERSELSDKEAEKWETKAKSGLLRKDTILSNLVSNMRNAVASPVTSLSGKYTTLSSIGISVAEGAATAWQEAGTLHLDKDKLKAALAEDPNIVYKLFNTSDNSGDSMAQGVAVRLNKLTMDSNREIEKYAGITASPDDQSTMGIQITSMNTKLKEMLAQNQKREDAFYKKYSAMEAAIGKIQSGLGAIQGMLG